MLFPILKNYEMILLIVMVLTGIAGIIYNNYAKHRVSSTAILSVFLGIMNYQNLEWLQSFCIRHHIGVDRACANGSSELLSIIGTVFGVLFGHIALLVAKKNKMGRTWKFLGLLGLLLSYPYLIYWLIMLAKWVLYAIEISKGHGP